MLASKNPTSFSMIHIIHHVMAWIKKLLLYSTINLILSNRAVTYIVCTTILESKFRYLNELELVIGDLTLFQPCGEHDSPNLPTHQAFDILQPLCKFSVVLNSFVSLDVIQELGERECADGLVCRRNSVDTATCQPRTGL